MGRRAIHAAVLKSQPLPYAGFEAVFSPSLALDFEMVFAGVHP
jgi:colicin import membrane protein